MKSLLIVFPTSFRTFSTNGFGTVALMLVGSAFSAATAQDSAGRRGGGRDALRAAQTKDSQAKPEKEIFSGPQVGEKLGEFPVWVVPAGDTASEKVDLRELSQKTPLAVAVMHGKDRPAFMMWRAMHAYGMKLDAEKLGVHLVMLTEDRSSEDQWLRGIVKRMFPKGGNFAIADGGLEGPGAVGLNRLAKMTILVVKDGKVTANFALTQVTAEVDAPKVLKAMAEAAGEKDVPQLKELLPQPNRMRENNQPQRRP